MSTQVPTLSQVPQQAQRFAPVAPILATWAQVNAGTNTRDGWVRSSLSSLFTARIVVQHLAHIALAAIAPQQPITGRVVDDYTARDEASLSTVTESPDDAEMRIERFVRATIEQYARDEILDISADLGATGWAWRTDFEPCDYCLEREGKEFGLDQEFVDHPNCGCYPEPIFDDGFSELAEQDAAYA